MASITKNSGGYRAQLYVRGVRDSKVFPTRREAAQWAATREIEIRTKADTPESIYTLGEAMRKFGEEVAPTHKGENWELTRLKAFERTLPIAAKIGQITAKDLTEWRDRRLACVSPATVLREFKLLNSIFEHARRDWRWIATNPAKDVRKPASPDHRDRIITGVEVRKVLRATRWARGPSKSITHSMANCFLFALCTGMRSGELTALTWSQVNERHISLATSKTGRGRDVPLSKAARRIIDMQRGFDDSLVFGLSASTRDTLFRRAKSSARVDGFTFHDARHTAATRLAKSRVFDVLTLCKVFGWSDPKMAMVYFNPTAKDLADLL